MFKIAHGVGVAAHQTKGHTLTNLPLSLAFSLCQTLMFTPFPPHTQTHNLKGADSPSFQAPQ